MGNGLDILNAAKKQKEMEAKGGNTNRVTPKSPIKEGFVSSSIEDLTSQYFGDDSDINEGVDYTLYPNGEKRPVYDAREEMKAIQNGTAFANKDSKMPSAILESIMRNPLNMPTEGLEVEEVIMDEALQSKTMDIINKLESRDNKGKSYVKGNSQPVNQQMQQLNEIAGYKGNVEMDNNDLASIIESIIDKKFKQYGSAIINESRKAAENSSTMKFMRLGESFTFMDDSNNIYECKMVYKGKGKIKQK